ncbi:hypothetical protein ISCGN_020058 [Ixodes scapularis]
MGRCCALKCRNRASRGIRLFKLPKSPRRRKLWLSGIKRGAGWKPPDSQRQYLTFARTSGTTLQVGLLTQPLPTTNGACFVSIFQGLAYPRVAMPPRSSLQVTSDNQRGQASSAARGTLVSADSTSWQPAARTSGAALQGDLLTQPLPTTSGACFVSIFQGPAYPRVAIPPRSSPQATSDNHRGQASSAARGTLVSADSISWQPAARTSGVALQGGLLTQPLPTTSGACFVSIFQGPAYPRVAIPPHPSLQVTSDNQRGQASAAALGTLVSAASTGWGGLLTQPLPTTSGACFVSIFQGPAYPRVAIPPRSSPQVTSDNQRGQASSAARGTLVSADSTSSMSRKIKQLENKNRRLVRQAALQKTREATFRSHLHKIFTADQLAALSRSSNRWSKWSNETVKKSLQMRFACGSTGYDLLLEGNFPLPSSRTLGRWLEGKFVVRLLKTSSSLKTSGHKHFARLAFPASTPPRGRRPGLPRTRSPRVPFVPPSSGFIPDSGESLGPSSQPSSGPSPCADLEEDSLDYEDDSLADAALCILNWLQRNQPIQQPDSDDQASQDDDDSRRPADFLLEPTDPPYGRQTQSPLSCGTLWQVTSGATLLLTPVH